MSGGLFVTGASGYVGSRVLQLAGSRRFERIVCLSRNACPAGAVEWVSGDLLDGATYASALATCDRVLHLAAATGKQRPEEYLRVNRDGTRVLVEQCRKAGVRNLLHVSTIAVKFHDTARYYYAQSKQQAEEIVAHSGLDYLIIRPTIVIGKGAPVLEGLAKLASAPFAAVFGDGTNLVQPVFVDDLAQALLSILEEKSFENRRLDFGGPRVVTMEEFLLAIRRICYGKKPRVVHIPAAPVSALLGLLETYFHGWMPLTAGQLASFTNDGTVESNDLFERWRGRMTDVEQVLQLVSAT